MNFIGVSSMRLLFFLIRQKVVSAEIKDLLHMFFSKPLTVSCVFCVHIVIQNI